jgi:hypothetical protein
MLQHLLRGLQVCEVALSRTRHQKLFAGRVVFIEYGDVSPLGRTAYGSEKAGRTGTYNQYIPQFEDLLSHLAAFFEWADF